MMRRRGPAPATVVLLILAVVLVACAVLFRRAATGLLWRALSPVMSARSALDMGEVSQLRAQLASTTAALADRNVLAAENAQLRAEFGRSGGRATILAGVLEHPPGTPYDTLIVDAGQAQGVTQGARVSVDGLEIGSIDEVYGATARVVLYSSPGSSYQATLITKSASIPVAVEGQGAGSLDARVPASVAVSLGDSVQFPGLNAGTLGRVTAVGGGESESFKTIYLRLPVNPFELRFVYIQK